jgi:hypothetical protein
VDATGPVDSMEGYAFYRIEVISVGGAQPQPGKDFLVVVSTWFVGAYHIMIIIILRITIV